MKLHAIQLLVLLFVPLISWGQHSTQQTIAVASSSNTKSGISLSWTLGQTISNTSGTENTLIAGIHQPMKMAEIIKVLKIANPVVDIYPNPFADYVFIKAEASDMIHLNISTLDGKEVYRSEYHLTNWSGKIDLGTISNGVYLLTVTTDQSVSHHKLIKK
ncbi:MAG: T9SS type A sorting domain-containing protein [Cyclobacteriaceae bacterium]